ncbi:MAG: hypothetical protein ACR2G5_12830 [Pyrinomonadaceae bacterium]
MLTNSEQPNLDDARQSVRLKLIAGLCAILITAVGFVGYAYWKHRTQQLLARAEEPKLVSAKLPKGPPKAHIRVDDALLKAGQTVIGGTVKNTSGEKLTGLTVGLELRRRKGRDIENTLVPVEPTELAPDEEGRYVLKLPAQQYSSVRLVGLKAGPDSALLAYTTSQGEKRPPERHEPKVVIVPRPGSRGGDFLNSPDTPARVP